MSLKLFRSEGEMPLYSKCNIPVAQIVGYTPVDNIQLNILQRYGTIILQPLMKNSFNNLSIPAAFPDFNDFIAAITSFSVITVSSNSSLSICY